MNLSFRTKLTALVVAAILLAVAGIGGFFLHLYRKDKLGGILESERLNATQAAGRVENLLNLSETIALEKVRSSKDILFVYEDPCRAEGKFRGEVSEYFQKHFHNLEITPGAWTESLELFKACSLMLGGPEPQLLTRKAVEVVPSEVQLMVPYLALLIGGKTPGEMRFVAIALDGFVTQAGNTLFMLGADGALIWSADGKEYLRQALEDTGLNFAELGEMRAGGSGIRDAGRDGVLAFAPLETGWTIFSLAYKPAILQPVRFLVRQMAFLLMGFVLLCIFIGKNFSERITRPLLELKLSAERIGGGDFRQRFELGEGKDEFTALKGAFNVMSGKIAQLVEETAVKAHLESELNTVQAVHKHLFPPGFVSLPGHELHSLVRSAEKCGGDWWGYIDIRREGHSPLLVLLAGDVTGHGTSSALVAAAVRGGLSVLSDEFERGQEVPCSPGQILKRFNRAVCEAAMGDLEMTFFAAVLDPDRKALYCANAGHVRPYLMVPVGDDSMELRAIGKGGNPLGAQRDTEYENIEAYLWIPGSKLFLYTDGLTDVPPIENEGTESQRGAAFGRRELQRFLATNLGLDGKAMLKRVVAEHEKALAGRPQSDDVTAIVCEMKQEGGA